MGCGFRKAKWGVAWVGKGCFRKREGGGRKKGVAISGKVGAKRCLGEG